MKQMVEKIFPILLNLSAQEVKSKIRTVESQEVEKLLDLANPLISAQALYKVCYLEEKYEDSVIIDGVRFRSHVLRKNLDTVGRVFPYVVTIGSKLEENASKSMDLLNQYYLDHIGNIALMKARKQLEEHLCSIYALPSLSFMSPGSLPDWPIEEQKPLFSLFKGKEEAIGVRLTENMLMIPRKSVSGIFFPTEVTFFSCQLCQRERCEGRKAPFSEDLVKEYKLKG